MLHGVREGVSALGGTRRQRRMRSTKGGQPRWASLRMEPLEPRWVLGAGPLLISEIMAVNTKTLQDADGDYSDWIEIYNPTNAPVSLNNWYLTDDATRLKQWEFPNVVLGSEQYMVVFASGKNRRLVGGELHTNFRLDDAGEYLALVRSDGVTVSHDFAPQYPMQSADVSYGLTRDGATFVGLGTEMTYRVPSEADAALGTGWTTVGFNDTAWPGGLRTPPVAITEVKLTDPNWVEIQNVVGKRVNTTGWVVAANNATSSDINAVYSTLWRLPNSMDPDAVNYRTESTVDTQHYWGESIYWRPTGKGWTMILDSVGNVVDFAVWGYTPAEIASLDVTINGFQVTAATAWSGESIVPRGTPSNSLQRKGNADTNTAADWAFVSPHSQNKMNTGLTTPFELGPANGLGFGGNPDGFAGAIRTNVGSVMRDISPTLWTRATFKIESMSPRDQLHLRLKYNDGFVAYLNGTEVARRNAPDTIAWNSTATAARSYQDSSLIEDIDISQYAHLLVVGNNTLAIQALNNTVADADFVIMSELVGTSTQGVVRFMSQATPGSRNLPGSTEAPAIFSHRTGVYTAPFLLELSAATSGSIIRYTLNGSMPSETSSEYMGPIPINTTSQVRARVYHDGVAPSPVASESFVFLGSDIQSVSSNLPIVVVDNFGKGGLPDDPAMQAAFVGIFDLDNGTSKLSNGPDIASRAGIRRRGSSTAGQLQTNIRFETWNDADEDKDISPLDMPAESDWILFGPYNFDRALIRNAFIYALSNQVGRYAVRTRFVEVYVNIDGGPLTQADYYGVYTFMENIKQGDQRVDIEQLLPTDESEPNISGGYIFKHDRRSSGDSGFNAGGTPFPGGDGLCYVDPPERQLTPTSEPAITAAQKTYLSQYINAFAAALNGPNFRDPEVGYAKYIDVESWIDHNWLNTMPMNVDAYRLSGYHIKDRGKKWELGPIWDYDRTMGSTDGRDSNPQTWRGGGDATDTLNWGWFNRLMQDPDFKQRWVDRWWELRKGVYSLENINAVIDKMVAEIGTAAAARHFAKWTAIPPRGGSWMAEINIMKQWLERRVNWIDTQFVKPPTVGPAGGVVAAGVEVTLSAPAGILYYTLDGSDPRALGGDVSPSARQYTGVPLNVADTTTIKVRAFNSANTAYKWSGLSTAEFYIGQAAGAGNLTVTELNYHPQPPTEAELAISRDFTSSDFEFIELRNLGKAPILLPGARLINAVQFDFSGSAKKELLPGEYVVVVSNLTAFHARYGTDVSVAGEYTGQFADSNEKVTLVDQKGATILEFTYRDSGAWPGRADGNGSSLEIVSTAGNYNDGNNWRSSTEYGGSPGFDGIGAVTDVVINEVLSRSLAPLKDTIELYNPTNEAIDIGGWYLSDSSAKYDKYRIADGTIIAAGGYLIFDEDDFNPDPLNPTVNDFALNGIRGDDVWLMKGAPTGELAYFADHVEFGGTRVDESLGRWPNGTGGLYPMTRRTFEPGQEANAGPRVGPLVISEVHYHPNEANSDLLEYLEVDNPTGEIVDLTNWRIRGGIDFDFPAGTLLAPRSALVVVPFSPTSQADLTKLAGFRAYYGIGAEVQILGAYSGKLSDNGEKVRLERPDVPPADDPTYIPHLLEDEVDYSATWYPSTSLGGDSLNRRGAQFWGYEAASWAAAAPTPGSAPLLEPRVVGRHIFYNRSAFDGNSTLADARDDAAIALDKVALMPGQHATFANYTSYSRGINGIMIDVTGLWDTAPLGPDDFVFRVGNSSDPSTWAVAPNPTTVRVRRGAGAEGTDRVTIVWPDNAIQKQWLQVTVLAGAGTGLTANDVFYFGNAIGETGNSLSDAKVDVLDVVGTRNHQRSFLSPAAIDFHYDFNRDRRVNAQDMLIAQGNRNDFNGALNLITAPSGKGAVDKDRAHDAVLTQAAARTSKDRQSLLSKLEWIHDLDSLTSPKRRTRS